MKNFIRIKFDGLQVSQINIDHIDGVTITYNSDQGQYMVLINTKYNSYIPFIGTFDECHFILNQLNTSLNIGLTDLNI